MTAAFIIADSDDSEDEFELRRDFMKAPAPKATSDSRSSDPVSAATGSTDPKFFQAIYDEQQAAAAVEAATHTDRPTSSASAIDRREAKKDETCTSSLTTDTDPTMGSRKKQKKAAVVDLTQAATPGRSAKNAPKDIWDIPSSPADGATVATPAKNKTPLGTSKRKHVNNVEFTSPLATAMPSQGSTQSFDVTPAGRVDPFPLAKRQRLGAPISSVAEEDDVDMVSVPTSNESYMANVPISAQKSVSLLIEPQTLSDSQRQLYEYHSVDPSPDDQRTVPSLHVTTLEAATRSSGATTIAYSTPSQRRVMGMIRDPIIEDEESDQVTQQGQQMSRVSQQEEDDVHTESRDDAYRTSDHGEHPVHTAQHDDDPGHVSQHERGSNHTAQRHDDPGHTSRHEEDGDDSVQPVPREAPIEIPSSPDVISAAPVRKRRSKAQDEPAKVSEAEDWNSDGMGFHHESYQPRLSRRRGSDASRHSNVEEVAAETVAAHTPVTDARVVAEPQVEQVAPASPPKPKKRGRPKKSTAAVPSPDAVGSEVMKSPATEEAAESAAQQTKKKRGRPKKTAEANMGLDMQEPDMQVVAAETKRETKDGGMALDEIQASDDESSEVEKLERAKKGDNSDDPSCEVEKPKKAKKANKRTKKQASDAVDTEQAAEVARETEDDRALQPTTPNAGSRASTDGADPPKAAAGSATPCARDGAGSEVAGKAEAKRASMTPGSASSQSGKPLYRVGLSRKSRIAPLLKSLRK
ncbi:hypothetical protein C8034_v002394 [Colletotrichum sidae]|uniref:AT hook domain-containing protein n=1 Tax=Colletotrichum sidae TaxID=1347389 RepID=A0A4R8TBV4_9PEZI|nr:hypothetical protein C8034_v002394 [Colletotrichum sidae]